MIGYVPLPSYLIISPFLSLSLAGQDYTELGGTLVFTSSSLLRMCVTIPILDDGTNENTESFSITFTQQTSSGPRVTVVSVFIIDNGGL